MFYSPQYPQKRELGVTPSKRSINIGWMKNKSLILNFNPAFITAANVIDRRRFHCVPLIRSHLTYGQEADHVRVCDMLSHQLSVCLPKACAKCQKQF